MNSKYPLPAWGIELDGHIIEGSVYGRKSLAERLREEIIADGLDPHELRIVALKVTPAEEDA